MAEGTFDAETDGGRRRDDGAANDPPPVVDDELPDDGGDVACWAHLVCPECGAVLSEGHLPGCPADPSLTGA